MRQRFILAFLAALLFGCASEPSTSSFSAAPTVRNLNASLKSPNRVDLAVRADRSLDGMIRLSAWQLEQKGYKAEATKLRGEWAEFNGYLPRIVRAAEAKGDFSEVPELYAPLSENLSKWYHMIKALLGEEMTERLHLDDIQVINWGTPTVLHLKVVGEAEPDAATYELFWNPWCGVVAYWGTWIACEIVTYGSGWFLICTPAATLAEKITYNIIAPRFSDRAWEFFYERERK